MCTYKAFNITPSINCYRVGAVAELEIQQGELWSRGLSSASAAVSIFGVSVACFHVRCACYGD